MDKCLPSALGLLLLCLCSLCNSRQDVPEHSHVASIVLVLDWWLTLCLWRGLRGCRLVRLSWANHHHVVLFHSINIEIRTFIHQYTVLVQIKLSRLNLCLESEQRVDTKPCTFICTNNFKFCTRSFCLTSRLNTWASRVTTVTLIMSTKQLLVFSRVQEILSKMHRKSHLWTNPLRNSWKPKRWVTYANWGISHRGGKTFYKQRPLRSLLV